MERAFSLFVCPVAKMLAVGLPGRLHDGLVAFVRALSLRPDHGDAWRSVGRLFQEQAR